MVGYRTGVVDELFGVDCSEKLVERAREAYAARGRAGALGRDRARCSFGVVDLTSKDALAAAAPPADLVISANVLIAPDRGICDAILATTLGHAPRPSGIETRPFSIIFAECWRRPLEGQRVRTGATGRLPRAARALSRVRARGRRRVRSPRGRTADASRRRRGRDGDIPRRDEPPRRADRPTRASGTCATGCRKRSWAGATGTGTSRTRTRATSRPASGTERWVRLTSFPEHARSTLQHLEGI